VLCCAVLCCAVLCCTVLCCAVLCILKFICFLTVGATVWICESPRSTTAFIFPATLLLAIVYGILNHGPLNRHQIKEIQQSPEYTAVSLVADEKVLKQESPSLLLGRLQFIHDIFPLFGYSFVTFCSYYLAFSSILTTLTFQSSTFRIRDHYQYYKVTSDIGMVLGGSEIAIVSCLCPAWLSVFRIRRIWIPVLVNVGHLMFFLFAAWYHFVPNVYILLVLCVTHGFVFGSTIVHIVVAAADKFKCIHQRGLALSITELGCSLGNLVSSLLGIFVESYLRRHCTNNLLMGHYCLARFSSNVGWNENLQCK